MIRRAGTILLLAAGTAGCGEKPRADAGASPPADTVTVRPTRQQALAEYRKCIRTMTTTESSAADGSRDHINTNPSVVCQHLLSQAYREPAHTRRREPDNVGHATPSVAP